MTTKLKKTPLGSLLAPIMSALVVSGAAAFGGTITYFGNVEGAQVTDWRTTTTSKTADLDGDNFYGTHGAVHWTVAGVNEQSGGSTTPGWAYHGAGAGFAIKPAYASIDHVNSYPTNTNAGIIHGAPATFTFELTGTAATYVGKTVRVGIMQDVLGSSEWANDTFKGLQISQTVGGSGNSGVIPLRSGGAGNGTPEMYFFDLTGVTAGDRFQISGLNGVGGAFAQAGYIGPVSWDVLPLAAGYSGWASGFLPAFTNTAADLDFENDGLASGIEWVVGGDPTLNDAASVTPTFDNTTDPNNLLFTFRRRDTAATDLNTTVVVEYGSDLVGWLPAQNGVNGVSIDDTTDLGGGFHQVTVAIPRALGMSGKLFARLRVAVVTP